MERKEMIAAIKQLFHFHKQATALEDEYLDEMYDFLVAEKKINLTGAEKLPIFTRAKQEYHAELNSRLKSDNRETIKQAGNLLRLLKINQLPKEENDKIASMCKRAILKSYFDKCEDIII
jgi:ferritin-like metal-binding protein YciE